jgi:cellulose synthase/poly-beta-1,6-N-acetylglucosamine synthase-like glycosyltransferase
LNIKFSIIIAVKNEEDTAGRLIGSLQQIDYHTNDYEVIFVDDNSSDNTYNLIKDKTKQHPNYKIIKTIPHAGLTGKKAALTEGINNSAHPYILTTDADCIIPKNWLKEYSAKFREGFQIVFGISPFLQENSFLNTVICYENFKNSLLSFTLAGAGLPYNAFGRNFGFAKEVFYKLDGYNDINKTLSGDDDLFLLKAAQNKYRIAPLKTPEAAVLSNTKKTLNLFLFQRSRHTKTSALYPVKVQLVLALWHIINLLCTGSLLLLPVSIYCILPFCVKMLFDIFITIKYQTAYGYKFNIFSVMPLQICYDLLIIIHFINSKITKDRW